MCTDLVDVDIAVLIGSVPPDNVTPLPTISGTDNPLSPPLFPSLNASSSFIDEFDES